MMDCLDFLGSQINHFVVIVPFKRLFNSCHRFDLVVLAKSQSQLSDDGVKPRADLPQRYNVGSYFGWIKILCCPIACSQKLSLVLNGLPRFKNTVLDYKTARLNKRFFHQKRLIFFPLYFVSYQRTREGFELFFFQINHQIAYFNDFTRNQGHHFELN